MTAAALALTLMAPAAAHAVLPSAISYEYFGFNFAENEETSDTVGTLDYTGKPGCGSSCVATTALGSNPSTSVNADEVVYQHTSGGYAEAKLGYYFEYMNTAGNYNFTLGDTDTLSISSGNRGQNIIEFGPAGANDTYFNNFVAVDYANTDCVNGCPDGEANYTSPKPFSPVVVSVAANTLYFIQIDSLINPEGDGSRLIASIDPTLTTTATGGQILFSPGVTSGVAEPGVWMMLILGAAGVGGGLRSRRRLAALQA